MLNPTVEKKQFVTIDILRAIAAFSVFYYHHHIGATLAKITGVSLFHITDAFGAAYAVPLFFLISGFCIHLSCIKYIRQNQPLPVWKYYKKRFFRIYPPFIIAVIFSLVVNSIVKSDYQWDSQDLLIHIFGLQGFSIPYFNTINIVLWTITVELAFYLIYPVFFKLRLTYSLDTALLVSFIVSVVSISYYYIQPSYSLPERYSVFNLWFVWCCGAYLADLKFLSPASLQQRKHIFAYAIIVIFFITLSIWSDNKYILFVDQFNVLIWTAPLILFLYTEQFLQKMNSVVLSILVHIGLSSYSLYLLHDPLIALKNFVVKQYLPANLQIGFSLVGIVLIPYVCWLSYKFIEKPFALRKI